MTDGPAHAPGALEEIIRGEISSRGPITFARFMELALYHPEHGYYNTREGIIGREGDFYTSANLHPSFGWLIANQLVQMWTLLGSPAIFTVAEMGAGRGFVCSDILSRMNTHHPECFEAVEYVIYERSAAMIASQRSAAESAGLSEKIRWEDFWNKSAAPFTGALFSNELIDAFPVHQVVMTENGLMENHVVIESGKLTMSALPPSTGALGEYFEKCGVALQPGQIAEVNLEAEKWMSRAAALIDRGFAITIDYGYEAKKLYGPARPRGTLMCYHRHKANEDPFARIGIQDMTAHVNFTSLMLEGEKRGLHTAGLTNQTFFLINLGLPEIASAPPSEDDTPQQLMNKNFSIKKMIDPDGLGRFGVLLQYKGLDKSPELDALKIRP